MHRIQRLALSLLSVCLLLVLPIAAGPAQAQLDNIAGQWLITATLIAKSEYDPQVREGFQKQEQWYIQQQGSQASITTPSGTITGQYYGPDGQFPQGSWQFSLEVPNLMNQPNLGGKFEVVIAGATMNMIQGGSSLTFYAGNPYTGQWTPAGMESWRFVGERLQ